MLNSSDNGRLFCRLLLVAWVASCFFHDSPVALSSAQRNELQLATVRSLSDGALVPFCSQGTHPAIPMHAPPSSGDEAPLEDDDRQDDNQPVASPLGIRSLAQSFVRLSWVSLPSRKISWPTLVSAARSVESAPRNASVFVVLSRRDC